MFAKVTRSGATAAGAFALMVMAFQCLGVVGPTVASASPTCSFSAGTLRLVDDGAGADSIDVWQDTDDMVFMTVGPSIGLTLPGGPCGDGIALSTIHEIDITGGTGASIITIWMSQTQPGQAPLRNEGPGADWGLIGWNIALTHDADIDPTTLLSLNTIVVLDRSPDDPTSVTAGTAGVDLNGDGELDVAAVGVDSYFLITFDRVGSMLSAAGGGSTGDPVNGLIVGGAGDDTILAGIGSGTFGGFVILGGINGGGGTDTIVGGPGRDGIFGGAGDDTISGAGADDILLGGGGADTIDGDSGSDLVQAGSGDDVVLGGSGDDFLGGGRGNDELSGEGGRDRCDGGIGDDSVHCEVVTHVGGPSLERTLPWRG